MIILNVFSIIIIFIIIIILIKDFHGPLDMGSPLFSLLICATEFLLLSSIAAKPKCY